MHQIHLLMGLGGCPPDCDCHPPRTILLEAVLGELNPITEQEVAKHLRDCLYCASLARRLLEGHRHLQQLAREIGDYIGRTVSAEELLQARRN